MPHYMITRIKYQSTKYMISSSRVDLTGMSWLFAGQKQGTGTRDIRMDQSSIGRDVAGQRTVRRPAQGRRRVV